MKVHIIYTEYNIPLYPPLKIVENYGDFTLDNSGLEIEGIYLVLEATMDDFMKWANLNTEFWLGRPECSPDTPLFEKWSRPQ